VQRVSRPALFRREACHLDKYLSQEAIRGRQSETEILWGLRRSPRYVCGKEDVFEPKELAKASASAGATWMGRKVVL
jgi:hypothetical protein